MKLPKIFKREKKQECTYDSHPTWYGKVWHFLAHEDSWASFIVDALIVILVGKFLIYPAIGFALGTSFPIVAVVSSSMDHQGMDFDAWWEANKDWYEENDITKDQFENFYKENGFKKGDVFVVKGVSAEELKVGDILVYSVAERRDPIIHRIVEIGDYDGRLIFFTKGDSNIDQISFEKEIPQNQIHGKAVAWAPWLGWPKVAYLKMIGQL